jgi:DMSO/TMAO reductase YedYZ molybdopterin-dependent catalytic subunit
MATLSPKLRERLAQPPPGPARPGFWRSPLRGPWLTAALGTLLLGFLVIVALTGFLSHEAYEPDLGRNAIVPRDRDLDIPGLGWPDSGPSWLYAVNQGLHVTLGIVAVPLLLAKLWSVIPRLFKWPPVASPADVLERVSLLLLVGGALFLFATGIVNAQIYYPFKFNFVVGHYYAAVVFTGALVLHVALQFPKLRRAYAERGALRPLLDAEASRTPEPPLAGGLAPTDPAPPSISRRGLFGMVGAAMGALAVTYAGQSIGGPLRPLAVLAPRGGGDYGDGPQDFPINKTARAAGITPEGVGDGYRLELAGGAQDVALSRGELLEMEGRAADLPIACVEGWSTTQRWEGVRLADLAAAAGAPGAASVLVESLQEGGVLRQVTLSGEQLADPEMLLALRVNGEDLSLDHGFPARLIGPRLPGVHCTKWVTRMTFTPA